jgi:hypothetical protein
MNTCTVVVLENYVEQQSKHLRPHKYVHSHNTPSPVQSQSLRHLL